MQGITIQQLNDIAAVAALLRRGESKRAKLDSLVIKGDGENVTFNYGDADEHVQLAIPHKEPVPEVSITEDELKRFLLWAKFKGPGNIDITQNGDSIKFGSENRSIALDCVTALPRLAASGKIGRVRVKNFYRLVEALLKSSRSGGRKHLACVCIENDLAIATDGAAMTIAAMGGECERKVVIPASIVRVLNRVEGGICEIFQEDGFVSLTSGSWTVTCKSCSAFPPWEQVIPDISKRDHFSVKSEHLSGIECMSQDRLKLWIYERNLIVEDGSGDEMVKIPLLKVPSNFKDTWVNKKYLLLTRKIGGVLQFYYDSPHDAIVVIGETAKIIVMPMHPD